MVDGFSPVELTAPEDVVLEPEVVSTEGGDVSPSLSRRKKALPAAVENRWYLVAHAVLSGKDVAAAYAEVYGRKPGKLTRLDAERLFNRKEFQEIFQSLRAADRLNLEAARREIVMGHLADMRNPDLAARDRIAARAELARMCGFYVQKVEMKLDAVDEYAASQIRQASSQPLVALE